MATGDCVRFLPTLRERIGAAGQFTDPLWNKVWLLHKFTEPAGDLDPIDDSIYKHGTKWTALGGQDITATGKFAGTNAFETQGLATDGYFLERSITQVWVNDTWTIEGWFKFKSFGAHISTFFSQWSDEAGNPSRAFILDFESTGSTIRFRSSNDGLVVADTISGSWSPSNDVWYHIAVQKTGTTVDVSVDGVNKATGTLANTINEMDNFGHQDGIWVAGRADNSNDFEGYIDSSRITIADRYQAYPFTIGALERHGTTVSGEFLNVDKDHALLPLGAEVDSLFEYVDVLLDFETDHGYGADGGVYNHAYKGTADPVNTDFIANRPSGHSNWAGIQSLFVKNGASAGDFTGSSGNIQLRVEKRHNHAALPFCHEAWVYVNNALGPGADIPTGHVIGGQWAAAGALTWLWWYTGNDVAFAYSTTGFDSNTVVGGASWGVFPGKTWIHMAVTRDTSNDINMWVDGVKGSTTTNVPATFAYPRDVHMLGNADNAWGWFLRGYMDSYRFTLGHPRYTSTFSPPAAFPHSRFANERPLTII